MPATKDMPISEAELLDEIVFILTGNRGDDTNVCSHELCSLKEKLVQERRIRINEEDLQRALNLLVRDDKLSFAYFGQDENGSVHPVFNLKVVSA